jgi:Glutaredoxin-like domain (DUF836)
VKESPAPATGVLYSRLHCPLCFVLERQARRASRRTGIPLRVVDVDASDGLRARYGAEVPVLELPGERPIRGRAPTAEVEAAFARVSAHEKGRRGFAAALPSWIRRAFHGERSRPGGDS